MAKTSGSVGIGRRKSLKWAMTGIIVNRGVIGGCAGTTRMTEGTTTMIALVVG
ncbi:MAG TPA: hypothetical protein VFK01_01785 [Bradyrhizobium sp.]|nr:hypothetical protein [Bradyrhizobium sp.]